MEHILRYALGEVSTLPPNLSRIENLLIELIGEIPSTITVDDALSDSSENPVQNKTLNAIINGTGSGSVYSKIMMAIAEVVADAPQDFDTLKEISDWISSHEDSAAAMNSAIQANATAITEKVDKETGKGLSTEDYTTAEKTKLAGIDDYANYIAVDSVISSVSNNPVKGSAIYAALEDKVDKVTGKGLSTEDYTATEKTKLAGIADNATDIGKLYPNSTHGEIFNNYSSNTASGDYSHAEGFSCTASGNYSHAEGRSCTASGIYSHAEGNGCTASKNGSHAEGSGCAASGNYSHASGNGTIAKADSQTTIGKYNLSDDNGTYAFVIGNGSNVGTRSNAFAVDWNGLIYVGNSATGVNVTNLVEKEQGKGLSTEDYTTAEKTKLAGLSNYDDTALQTAVTNKVDKVTGKGLSTEDYTTAEKNKLAVLSELNTATVTIDLNSQTWTESANGLFYTGNISVTNLYVALSAIITGFSALKTTDNIAVIANSNKTAIRLTASTNTFSNNANITVSVFGRFTS